MVASRERLTSLRQPAFVVVTAIQFVNVLVNGSTTMALPSIKSGLGATNSNLQWFAALFAMAFSLVLVLSGRLGDLYGARRLLLFGFALFVVAITLEAASPTIWALLGARVLQGLSGGLMAPQLSAVIQRTFRGHSRTRAFAVYLTAAGAGFSVGQLLGGALMTTDLWGLGWRWAFLPFVLPAVALWLVARRTVPDLAPEATGRLDVPGAVMLGTISFLMMFPLIQGRNAGWPVWIFAMLVSSVPVFVAFFSYERRLVRRGGSPLVNPDAVPHPDVSSRQHDHAAGRADRGGGTALLDPHRADRLREEPVPRRAALVSDAARQHGGLAPHGAAPAAIRAADGRDRRGVQRARRRGAARRDASPAPAASTWSCSSPGSCWWASRSASRSRP